MSDILKSILLSIFLHTTAHLQLFARVQEFVFTCGSGLTAFKCFAGPGPDDRRRGDGRRGQGAAAAAADAEQEPVL